MRGVPMAVSRMFSPKSLRYKYFDSLPNQFFARVTEQSFCLRVDQEDASIKVADEHRIRRGFQNPTEFDFACAHRRGLHRQRLIRLMQDIEARKLERLWHELNEKYRRTDGRRGRQGFHQAGEPVRRMP